MQTGTTSGAQIVFLSFAVLLLAVPLSLALQEMHGGTPAEGEAIGRAIPFVLGVLVAMAFPGLRHRARADLAVPIPVGKRAEVLVVTIAKLSLALAFMGGIALWRWLESGSTGLEQVGGSFNREASAAFAFSPLGLVMFFLVAAIVGPVLEELLFRDFLQRAWEKKWGWAGTVVMTSTLFALYHRHFVLAFVSGVVFSCAVRRTGSLWSAIAVHSCVNAAYWYPLLGQFLVPLEGRPLGHISSWWMHLACLAFATFAVPAYVVMAARHPYRLP